MAEIIKAEGVREDVMLEDQSFDTFGNAIFTASRYLQHMEPGTLFVVTSPFHMERAVYIFEQVLGPKWKVVAHEAQESAAENRQSGAPAAMVRARDFFGDVTPGDLAVCMEKLLKRIPAYKARAA